MKQIGPPWRPGCSPIPLQVRVSTLGKILEDCPKLVCKREHYEMNNRIILIIPDIRTGQARQGGHAHSPPGCGQCLVGSEEEVPRAGKRDDGELEVP